MEQQSPQKTFHYKLKPRPERELGRVLGLCCDLYTAALEQRITAYQRRHASVSRYEQEAELKSIRADSPEYAAAHSHVLQDALAPPDKAYQAFFHRIEPGEKAGCPGFKATARSTAFTYKEFSSGTHLNNGFLVLSKIGHIAVRWSRPLESAPKAVTVSREADGWYVCFSCADVRMRALRPGCQDTGIDLGIEAFATPSAGTGIFHPGRYRQAERALKTAQRRVSWRKKGSNRRRRALTPLTKAHQKAPRQQQDFQHKTTFALVHANDVIFHEDLQTANMVTNHHLAKSISDAGWSAFLTILSFKAACAVRSVIAEPPAFASQRCSGCEQVVWKGLSACWRHCPYQDCSTSLHRGHTTANNRERLWQSRRGGLAVAALEDRASVKL
jgi:putative transposase